MKVFMKGKDGNSILVWSGGYIDYIVYFRKGIFVRLRLLSGFRYFVLCAEGFGREF